MNFIRRSSTAVNLQVLCGQGLFRGLSVIVGLCMLMSVAACSRSQSNKLDIVTVYEEYKYFSAIKLDMTENDTNSIGSYAAATVVGDKIAVLEIQNANGVKESQLYLYNADGTLSSSTKLGISLAEDESVSCMSADTEGNIVLVLQSKTTDQTTFSVTTTGVTMYMFDVLGQPIGEPVKIAKDFEYNVGKIILDSNGNLYVLADGQIFVYDKTGNELYSIKNSRFGMNAFLIGKIVFVEVYEDGNDGNSIYKLYPLDNTKKKLGSPVELTKYLNAGMSLMSCKDGLFAQNQTGVYAYDFDAGKMNPVLAWSNSDFSFTYDPDQVFMISKDAVFVKQYSDTGEWEVYLLVRGEPTQTEDVKTITIGGMYLDSYPELLTEVAEFNKNNKEYVIELKDYANDATIIDSVESDDTNALTNAMITQMNLDILSGDGPDIFVRGDPFQFSAYESQGVFVDLYSLMEKDSSFTKEDFMQNLFEICETDGHLYKMGTSYAIIGLEGKQSIIGDRSGWTVDEFNEMVDSLPSEMKPFHTGQTQSQLICSIFDYNINEFINQSTGKVNFDTETFYKLLDFAKTYGLDDENPQIISPSYAEMVKTFALSECVFLSPSDYNDQCSYYGEQLSVVGYPSQNRNSASVSFQYLLSISSASDVVDGSWAFISSLLSEEAQERVSLKNQDWTSYLPIRTSVLEAQIDAALQPTEDDLLFFLDNNMYQTQPLTEETAQAFWNLVNGLNCFQSYDNDIRDIIREEAPAYFTNQKSAQDVAALIQNRVQTLVSERG